MQENPGDALNIERAAGEAMKALLFPFGPTEPSVQLTKDFPELEWTVVASPEDVARAAPDAAIYVTSNRTCKPETGEALRRHGQALRWMHFTSAGIDNGIAMGIPEGVIVTNSAGVRAGNVSEHALMLLLALMRQLPGTMAYQRTHDWRRAEVTKHVASIEGAVVCVIGRGPIGRELARKLKALNARPITVSRTADQDDVVEQVFPRERLAEALAISDAVAICTAGDETSRHMIGEAAFAAMKPSAVIVNVARGSIIDEVALIAALRQGRIAGAGLDVAEAEPMDKANPLWDLPNVIVTPHVAGQGSTGYPQQRKLFADNLARFREGRPMLNLCQVPART
jgi:phosphoglycerate dehydrogenase-like enzyme